MHEHVVALELVAVFRLPKLTHALHLSSAFSGGAPIAAEPQMPPSSAAAGVLGKVFEADVVGRHVRGD
jgi:hypothetical protein